MQRSAQLSVSSFPVKQSCCLFENLGRRYADHGVEVAVVLLDLCETLPDKAEACEVASVQEFLQSFSVNGEEIKSLSAFNA